MRTPVLGYILIALATAAVIFLIASACSWNILTRGEINDCEDPPDTLNVESPDPLPLEDPTFIEMEVGELDSLPVDSTETP